MKKDDSRAKSYIQPATYDLELT